MSTLPHRCTQNPFTIIKQRLSLNSLKTNYLLSLRSCLIYSFKLLWNVNTFKSLLLISWNVILYSKYSCYWYIYLIIDLAIAILHVFPNIPIEEYYIRWWNKTPVVILFNDDLIDTESIRVSVWRNYRIQGPYDVFQQKNFYWWNIYTSQQCFAILKDCLASSILV